MININELIGIINGINFDGIINQLEIKCLQDWVEKNRNLSYEARQEKLIVLVDKVLEDKVITDSERELVLEYCNECIKDINVDIAKTYELNGIIEGIICDDELNEREIYCLKEWMDKNNNVIRKYGQLAKISDSIEDVFSDGIVTTEEQSFLKIMLAERINKNQLEVKIEDLRKSVKDRKNIGIELIDLLDNEDVIDEIHTRAEREMNYTLNTYTLSYISDPEIVFISLVLIAMLHYDGNFYDYAKSTYKKLYTMHSEQKIEALIRTVADKYKNTEGEGRKKTRTINSILYNAIVPRSYLKSFFEFIYDIYKLNFDFDITTELYNDFQFVYDGLSEIIKSNGDEVKLNATKKIYKLIKTTKQLLSDSKGVDVVIKLSVIVVRLIDSYVWNKEVKIYNPYLKKAYEEWTKSLVKDNPTRISCRKSEFRSRWEPKYVLNNNNVYIIPPIHRVKSQYDYRNMKILVKNGDEVLYENKMLDIREIIGGYQISVSELQIDRPLGKVSYLLMDGNKTIYNSGNRLYRDFLVFDDQGLEIKNNTDYNGTAVFCTGDQVAKLRVYNKTSQYMLSFAQIHVGDAFIIREQIFNFSSLARPGVMGEKYENHYLVIEGTKDKIFVYKDVPVIVFEHANKSRRFEIQINGKRYKIDDFETNVTEKAALNKYVVNLGSLESGVYSIYVYSLENGKRERILNSNFAIDKNLKVKTEKSLNGKYMVYVESDFLDDIVVEEIDISKFKEDWFTIKYCEITYFYYIPLDFTLYRIDEGEWKNIEEEIWIGDIKQNSNIDLYGFGVESIEVFTDNGKIIEDVPELSDKGIFKRLAVGFLLSYKLSCDYVIIYLLVKGQAKKGIFCYNQCVLDERKTEVIYDHVNESLNILPRFHGRGRVFLKINNESGKEVYSSSLLTDGVVESIYSLQSFENYKITFYEKEKGLSLKKERLLWECNTIFYDRKGFIGRSFKIIEVYFDQQVRGEFLRKRHYFNKSYVYFSKMIDDNFFEGNIYVKTYRGVFELENINPIEIEICSDVIEGMIELAITKDGDGLLLDFEHHGIMNTMDDNNAVDIFSYNIDVKGEKIL